MELQLYALYDSSCDLDSLAIEARRRLPKRSLGLSTSWGRSKWFVLRKTIATACDFSNKLENMNMA
jgi:hypothetical protein